MPIYSACGTVGSMVDLIDVEERLTNLILRDHGVTMTLLGLQGIKGGFVTHLPDVPRPGDRLTFALKGRRGQGCYVVKEVEWVVAVMKEAVVHLVPDDSAPRTAKRPLSWG
jgi:hypothetical protein